MLSVKNLEKGDIMGICEFVNEEKDKKNAIVLSSTFWRQIGSRLEWMAVGVRFEFLEREGVASL